MNDATPTPLPSTPDLALLSRFAQRPGLRAERLNGVLPANVALAICESRGMSIEEDITDEAVLADAYEQLVAWEAS